MDNWGDPWADNAKSPTKHAVTSPLSPTFAPAPALLNGFLDDAGWGNEDESFGDWSTAPAEEEGHAPPTNVLTIESYKTPPVEPSPEHAHWHTLGDSNHYTGHGQGSWAEVTLDAPQDEELVPSETSDSSTAVQANKAAEHDPDEPSQHLQAEDGSSVRTSTSPSEASHNDALVESPRTSYEEERGVEKDTRATDVQAQAQTPSLSLEGAENAGNKNTEPEASADVPVAGEVTDKAESMHSDAGGSLKNVESSEFISKIPAKPSVPSDSANSVALPLFGLDSGLLEQLFTPLEETQDLDAPPDDPIYSTEARKAWYRLTRKQTMREFNHGDDDDNYVRITWTTSHIRSEVNSIVGRWAREDRLSGRGPGARASFYWDSPAPVDVPMHGRQRSSVGAASITASAQKTTPPLSTHVPAAFGWSSASPSVDPWQHASPGLRSTTLPLAPPPHKTSFVSHVRKQDARAVSLDLTSHKPVSAKHARNLTVAHETPIVANLISSPAPLSDPWAGLNILDAPSTPKDEFSNATIDDDDEWGEMVSSPTVLTPTLIQPTSQADARNKSTTTTTPQSNKSTTVWDHSPDAMSTTTIVRLKSTISPTSAYFKAKSFVPLGVEQGPIGPGILKPAKRSISITAKKVDEKPVRAVEQEVPILPKESASTLETSINFSEHHSSIPNPSKAEQPNNPPPPPPSSSTQEKNPQPPPLDPWTTADFSIFESPPPPQSPPHHHRPHSSSSFCSSSSSSSSNKTFTRSPPRPTPAPPSQPLTGATSSAQRRKAEEDALIREIVHSLPDLSYMLV